MKNKLILVIPIFCDLKSFNYKLYKRSKANDYLGQKNDSIAQTDLGNIDDLWMDEAQILRNKATGEKLEQKRLPLDISDLSYQKENEDVVPVNAVLFYRDGTFDDRKFLCLVIEACIKKESFDTSYLEQASNKTALEIIHSLSEQSHVIRWIGRTLICNESFVPEDWVAIVPMSADVDLKKALKAKDCLFGWGNNLIVTEKELGPKDIEQLKKGLVDAQYFWVRGETISDEVSAFFEAQTSEGRKQRQAKTLEQTTHLLEKYFRLYEDSDWYRKKAQGIQRMTIERELAVWNYPEIVSVIGDRLDLAERIADRKREKAEIHFQNAIEILLLATGLISILSLLLEMFSLAYSGAEGNIVTYFKQTDMDSWLIIVTALLVLIIINQIIHDIRR